MKENETVQH